MLEVITDPSQRVHKSVAANIWGPSVLNWLHVTLPTPEFEMAARSMENLWAHA